MLTETSRLFAKLQRNVADFKRSGETPDGAYPLMRHLHPRTRGRSSDWVARETSEPASPPSSGPSGILSGLNGPARRELLSGLRRDGFAISPLPLPTALLQALKSFALETPARYVDPREPGSMSRDEVRFDPAAPRTNRLQFRLEQMVTCDPAMALAFDDSLHAIARDYLNCEPVLDLVTMWWSAPGPKEFESAAAQRFHFDLDRSRFLKAFVYLTDVGPDNGPHCYVRGSHNVHPAALDRDGRYDDALVKRAFGQDAITNIEGPAGQVFFADTRGIHRGLPCRSGHRLIFQMEFSASLFGGPLTRVPASTLPPDYARRAAQESHRFSGILTPRP